MTDRVAIVTGSNKGIGLAIVKGLCERFQGVVYLTSRDVKRGENAVTELKKHGLKPEFHQLDVADVNSVIEFRDHIKRKHGGIDVLVNNAGVAAVIETYEKAVNIININYRSLLTIQELLFPLLRDKARVINISSDCGHLSNIRNEQWIKNLSKKDITVDDVNSFVDWHIKSLANGTFNKADFADEGTIAAYRVSKVGVCALSFLQQKAVMDRDISVNCMHPGLVQTDMTWNNGFLSPEESAETPLYLALDAPQTLKGSYVWYDGKVLDWYDHKADYYFKTKSVKPHVSVVSTLGNMASQAWAKLF